MAGEHDRPGNRDEHGPPMPGPNGGWGGSAHVRDGIPVALPGVVPRDDGPLAQLVERHVYTVDVIGSSPVGLTSQTPGHCPVMAEVALRRGW